MQYPKFAGALCLTGLTLAALSSQASVTTSFSANLDGAPTYNRLCVGTSGCVGGSSSFGFPVTLSGVGTAVHYVTAAFEVSQAGAYSFFSQSTNWDNYTFLYRNSFAPQQPFNNLVTGNDDLDGINLGGTGPYMNVNVRSGFSSNLDAGTRYVFVNTSYDNDHFGHFTASITGPAALSFLSVSAVPEPGSSAMLALGLAGLAMVGRRRKPSQQPEQAAAQPA